MAEDVLPDLVAEHAEEAAFLWLQRRHAVHAPHYDPQQFHDLDERLAANLDGLNVAGDAGWKLAEQALEAGAGAEDFFVAGALSLTAQSPRFDAVVARAKNVPEAAAGLISALGWVSSRRLAGRVTALIEATDPLRRRLGIAACALHRKDPGPVLATMLEAPPAGVRSYAARAAGELGRTDLKPALAALCEGADPELAFRAACSLTLLGDRAIALRSLAAVALRPDPRQQPALELALLAMEPEPGHALLAQLDPVAGSKRLHIIGAGLVGDVRYVPWLIDAMYDPAFARIAAEAFVFITGADFNLDQLESMPPDGYDDGPSDDPDDENVELPEDVALPWPDLERLKSWWTAHRADFAVGRKLFLGHPVTAEHCVHVLKTGYQRQRVIAAHYRALIDPGTLLFPTSAPAWRQQRWLAAL